MVSPVPLRALSAFEATARHSSMARAAQELGVSSSAVSQQIKWLENYLQRQLFQRSKRPMVLSEAGDRLFNQIFGAFNEIDNALHRMEPAPSHSALAIRTPPSLTAKWLIYQIKDYRRLHPDIELRVDAVNEFLEFDWSGFDLDIRSGTGTWPSLFSYPLMEETITPLCSPDYQKNGPIALSDITGKTLISSEKSPFSWNHWFQKNSFRPDQEPESLRFDRSFLSIEAAKQGMGIALESTFLAHQEIATGKLIPAIAESQPLQIRQHWIVCPYQRLRSTKVRNFISWLWDTLPNVGRSVKPDI